MQKAVRLSKVTPADLHDLSTTGLGWWRGNGAAPLTGPEAIGRALRHIRRGLFVVEDEGRPAVAESGSALLGESTPDPGARRLLGYVPPCPVEALGDASFCADHGLRYAYVTGAMANGIGSAEIVEAMSKEGMLSFFGAAGLPLRRVEEAVDRITRSLGNGPYGFNLIHSPNEPGWEAAVADLYLRRGVRLVEASAFLDLTPPIVRYRTHGLRRDENGRVVARNRLIAKISRVEVARKFLAPPPEAFLNDLVRSGDLTKDQARMAREIPMAQDLTAEADSGGHTDNRPAIALLPTMLALRDRMQKEHGYAAPLRVGAAGGIATPHAAAAAYAMGAAYILTGSVNQACIEAGTSDSVREMLAAADQADIAMAPAADMFEMGVKVQVLKRGTMFAMRAAKLYELYRTHDSIDAIPADERAKLEKTYFRAPFDEILEETRRHFLEQDPAQWERAGRDPKHRMALAFRWYLGLSSSWANSGENSRKVDYQIWCGPAMGAFNEWVRGSFLEEPKNRHVVTIALNILFGTAVLTRIQALRGQGIRLGAAEERLVPLPTGEVKERLA